MNSLATLVYPELEVVDMLFNFLLFSFNLSLRFLRFFFEITLIFLGFIASLNDSGVFAYFSCIYELLNECFYF